MFVYRIRDRIRDIAILIDCKQLSAVLCALKVKIMEAREGSNKHWAGLTYFWFSHIVGGLIELH